MPATSLRPGVQGSCSCSSLCREKCCTTWDGSSSPLEHWGCFRAGSGRTCSHEAGSDAVSPTASSGAWGNPILASVPESCHVDTFGFTTCETFGPGINCVGQKGAERKVLRSWVAQEVNIQTQERVVEAHSPLSAWTGLQDGFCCKPG